MITILEPLTNRENDVASLIGRGYGNAKIARALQLSNGTITNMINNMWSKISVPDGMDKRVCIALYYRESIT